MGKAEVGTPKWIGNRIKAKGLQKLRWYCQMCEKQCRDENGFKCHTMSEAHQRQLLIFAETPDKFLDTYSKDFEEGFLTQLKRTHGTKRVFANQVYKEYIADRHHIHMNSTEWVTLTEFIKYLGTAGHCVVDETEKGWYITYIDRDPETIARQEALKRRDKLSKDDDERMAEFIRQQVEREKERRGSDDEDDEEKFTELQRKDAEEKIRLDTLKLAPKRDMKKLDQTGVFKKPKLPESSKKREGESSGEKRKVSALEEIMKEEEERKKKMSGGPNGKKDDHWLKTEIVVKIVTKTLGDKYYKEKGYVKEVLDRYTAVVVLLSNGAKLKLDQVHLETVIPGIGKPVLILKGPHRGKEATLKELDIEKFCAVLEIATGSSKGEVLKLPYEHFSKLHIK